ncbi:MAG: protein kinase, partial [Chloroflexaceae bacterium]|nr:protein kinase [Chloroflexaceae bacterium]
MATPGLSGPDASSFHPTRGGDGELLGYRLHRQIRQDELATIYAASHMTLDRPVQVHILRRTDWVSVSRFQLAARLAAHFTHPNLLPVIDAGYDDGYGYYMVTPTMECHLLSAVLEGGPLDPVLVLRVATQLAGVLDYLHAHNVFHRDIQPSNVLLTPEGVAYLTNLSLAASPDTPDLSSIDEADYLTPYSAPEQRLDQSEASPALDVYGLGALLFHAFSGTIPPAPGMALPSLSSVDPSLGHADAVLQGMLDVDPAARFVSTGEAVAALRRALHDHVQRSPDDMEESRWEPAAEWLENPVETVLGDLLDQGYMSRSRSRADTLHRADAIRRLLNRWSRKGHFRRPSLGHLVQLEQIVSYNIYFYELRTLYETRTTLSPRRRPIQEDERNPILPMPELWEIAVPDVPRLSEVKPQELVWPNSKRVVPCDECQGRSTVVCPTCQGKGTVEHSRKVRNPDHRVSTEKLPEVCPTCHGYRYLPCPVCEEKGSLVEELLFSFSRQVEAGKHTDDIEGLPIKALLQRQLELVYQAASTPTKGAGTAWLRWQTCCEKRLPQWRMRTRGWVARRVDHPRGC